MGGPADVERFARMLGALHFCGAALAVAYAFLFSGSALAHAVIVVAAALAALCGAALVLYGGRLGGRGIILSLFSALGLLTVAALASTQHAAYPFLLLLLAMYAFCFLPRRLAYAYAGISIVAFGVVLLVNDAGHLAEREDPLRFSTYVVVLLASGMLIRHLTERLSDGERHLRELVERTATGVTVVDLQANLVEMNDVCVNFLGRSREEVVDRPLADQLHPEDFREMMVNGGRAVAGHGDEFRMQMRFRHADGHWIWVQLSTVLVRDKRGRPVHFWSQADDINAQVEADERQAELARLGVRALELSFGVLAADALSTIARRLRADVAAWVPDAGAPVAWGWDDTTLAGVIATGAIVAPVARSDLPVAPVEAHPALERRRLRAGLTCGLPGGVLALHTVAERTFALEDQQFAVAVGGVLSAAALRADEARQSRHRALHDPLTGLANRALVRERLAHPRRVAALFLDLDHFKVVNDSLGHEAGDTLLCAVAERLSEHVRGGDLLARLGGDEFVVLCEDAGDEVALERLAARLLRALREPFLLGDGEVFVSASVGIAIGDGEGDADSLLRDADAAMYRAKDLGRDRVARFDHRLGEQVRSRLALGTALNHALERDELSIAYQPVVALVDERPVGAEALLRWHHPEHGQISPADFVPIAEETGIIGPIGAWVLSQACGEAASWSSGNVSVNLSPRQIAMGDVVGDVRRALRDSGLAPERLLLEVTETALLADDTGTAAVLERLRGLGVRLALDDFGTGYSALSYLTRMPLDVLKLDRAFVARVPDDPKTVAVCEAIASMATALDLAVVAEGIESEAQALRLREMGCTMGQGWLFARPMAPELLPFRRPAAPVLRAA